jgi:hypothetical protein
MKKTFYFVQNIQPIISSPNQTEEMDLKEIVRLAYRHGQLIQSKSTGVFSSIVW